MKTRFFKFTLKSLFVPGLILGGILVIAAFLIGITANVKDVFRQTIDNYGNVMYSYQSSAASSGLTVLVCLGTGIAFIMPFFVLDYRYSIKKADIYYQAPFNEKYVRNTRILAGLLYIVVIFTVAFLLTTSVYLLRLIITPEHKLIEGGYETRGYFYVQYYLLGYVLGMFGVAATYLITCYFASLATSCANAIALALEGLFLLGCTVAILTFGLLDVEYNSTNYSLDAENALSNFSMTGFSPVHLGLYFAFNIEKQAVGNVYDQSASTAETVVLLIDSIAYICIAGLLSIPLFLQKEPSGEFSGKGFGSNKLERIIHHTAFGLLCFASYIFCIDATIILFVIGYTIICTFYFLTNAGLNRSFKFKINDLLPFIISMGGSFISSIVFWFICMNAQILY